MVFLLYPYRAIEAVRTALHETLSIRAFFSLRARNVHGLLALTGPNSECHYLDKARISEGATFKPEQSQG